MRDKNKDCGGIWLVFLAAAILIFSHCSSAAAAEAIVLGDERTDEYLPLLAGKRIALFANHSAMVKGEHLLELLLRNGEHVTVLYTPEHGIRGDKAAGETIEDGTDPVTGIPIVSLFSGVAGTAKPSSETMGKFDTLVIDIQDVGLRYYTYYIAVCDLLEECSAHGKEVILLDRPNLNGHYVDFDLFMGRSYVREAIRAGKNAREIRSMWRRDVESFIEKSKPYLLYEREER